MLGGDPTDMRREDMTWKFEKCWSFLLTKYIPIHSHIYLGTHPSVYPLHIYRHIYSPTYQSSRIICHLSAHHVPTLTPSIYPSVLPSIYPHIRSSTPSFQFHAIHPNTYIKGEIKNTFKGRNQPNSHVYLS